MAPSLLAGITQTASGGYITLSGLAVGSSNAVKHRWLAGGSASSREGNTLPWATPPSRRDSVVLESGGWNAVKRPVRLANMETISVLNLLPRPLFSTYRGNQFWGYTGTARYTLPALFPPPPLLTPPWVPSLVEEDLLTVCWRSHFFHIPWERGAQWGQGLSIQQERCRNFEHSGCGSKSGMNESHFFWPFLLIWMRRGGGLRLWHNLRKMKYMLNEQTLDQYISEKILTMYFNHAVLVPLMDSRTLYV